MEEIHYKKRLEDLTNRELKNDVENLFLNEHLPEEIEAHLEILHYSNPADPADRDNTAVSRNILFNYIMQNYVGTEPPIAKRRINGGRQGKKSKRRKGRKGKKSKKRRKSQRRR
jgi:hypothetical protein